MLLTSAQSASSSGVLVYDASTESDLGPVESILQAQVRAAAEKPVRIFGAHPPHEAGFVGTPDAVHLPRANSRQAGTPKQASALLAARIHPTKQASWGPRMSNTLTPVFPTPRNPRVSRGPRVGGSLDLDHLITKSLGRVSGRTSAGVSKGARNGPGGSVSEPGPQSQVRWD